MEISSDKIRDLRERTGVGMGKCKEALVLAGGDMEKAIDHLRKTGMAAGVKKEGRETKEGMILVKENSSAFVMLEANAETDFVVQNDRFKAFVEDVAQQALESKPQSLDALLAEPYSKDKTITIDQYRSLVIQTLGENIQVRRLQVMHKYQAHSYGIYSHMGGKLVVVVDLEGATGQEALAKEIAMHIAAESPDYLRIEEVPSQVREREEEIALSQIKGKPENLVEKIVASKLQAFYAQVCLLHQKYVKDNAVTVAEFLERRGKELGKTLSVHSFWRWKVGQ
ncbi:MAG: elongation factor Ts [Verrucomicrobiota bacterium]|nr:elongation factor Ts [Verrucomicrobiota bacterium]